MLSNGTIVSGSLSLPRYLVQPAGKSEGAPGVIMLHSFPFGPIDARHSASSFPELMDRLANELGFAAMCFTFRGCGESPGDFSLQGWVDDLRAAIDHMISETNPTGLWLIGSNTGGSLAMCVGADDPRIKGCALLGPRADFDDWAAQPRKFLDHCRSVGSVQTPQFPKDFDEWTRELRRFRPVPAAQRADLVGHAPTRGPHKIRTSKPPSPRPTLQPTHSTPAFRRERPHSPATIPRVHVRTTTLPASVNRR